MPSRLDATEIILTANAMIVRFTKAKNIKLLLLKDFKLNNQLFPLPVTPYMFTMNDIVTTIGNANIKAKSVGELPVTMMLDRITTTIIMTGTLIFPFLNNVLNARLKLLTNRYLRSGLVVVNGAVVFIVTNPKYMMPYIKIMATTASTPNMPNR
jgi:hypothetical protein